MEANVFISIYLDTRRAKANNKYPVKLRVFSNNPRKQVLYPTKFSLTKDEFNSIWVIQNPRGENKNTRLKLQDVENNANNVANKITPFSFEIFEKKLYRKVGEGGNIFYHYDLYIKKLKGYKQIGTASNYELSQKSLKKFIQNVKGNEAEKINFSEITPDWLTSYENYMINTLERSSTTVSMYIRALRTIFNIAISEKEIDPEMYPFGKRKYQPPAQTNTKKALPKTDLKKLFKAKPSTIEQAKARDFWFFSYTCNGMNIKDIALLKFKNIKGNTLEFYRAKTMHTAKTDLRPVTVYLTDFAQTIIKKYANQMANKDDYLFPILSKTDTELTKHNKIKNFTKFINQNLKKLALKEGITGDISTYWARHSFATNAVRNGASMEFVSEALSHSSLKTTKGYFAGFEEKSKMDIMNKLMKF